MAPVTKTSSRPQLELPPDIAEAVTKLLPPETVSGLKRLLEQYRRAIPDLKRLSRHLSPEEQEVFDEITRRRRELIREVRQLHQLEEQFDRQLGGRWWDDGGGFLVLPVTPTSATSKKTAPPAAPVQATSALPAEPMSRQEWWNALLTEEREVALEIEYKDAKFPITAAAKGILALMQAAQRAKKVDAVYAWRHIEHLLREAGLFRPAS